MLRIKEALKSVDETKALVIESDAINKVAKLFADQFPGETAVIVADQYMYELLGKKVADLLDELQVTQDTPFVFSDQELLANYENVELLSIFLKKTKAIPIAIGSGIINDLAKLASHNTERRYMCVVTAASVDGYTAYGASITLNGSKQTFSCPAPLACLVDVDIVRNAPITMSASGYADVFAKVTSGADWILADSLGVEAINPKAWSIAQGGLHKSLSNPEGIIDRERDAFALLTERLMLSGLAMQQAKSTRPASGAEHHFSHLWDMEHHLHNNKPIAHGFQVAIGILAITAFYEQLLETNIEDLDVELCCSKWPSLDFFTQSAKEMFNNTDFPEIGVEEMKAKYISKEELRDQLTLLKKDWAQIKAKLSKQLIPFAEVKRCFKIVGVPTEPEEIGITRKYLKETFHRALYIRRRFTILDLAIRINMTEKWLDVIFAEDGIWTINDYSFSDKKEQ